jgi:hypothetical protein
MELLAKNSEWSNIFHPDKLIIDLVDLFRWQNSNLTCGTSIRGRSADKSNIWEGKGAR